MRVEFRRAAFVVLDMGVAVADDAAVGRAERGEREAFAAVPVATQSAVDLGLEQLGEGAVEPRAPGVAVIGGVEPVGGGDRRHHLGAGGGRIVGEEAHGAP